VEPLGGRLKPSTLEPSQALLFWMVSWIVIRCYKKNIGKDSYWEILIHSSFRNLLFKEEGQWKKYTPWVLKFFQTYLSPFIVLVSQGTHTDSWVKDWNATVLTSFPGNFDIQPNLRNSVMRNASQILQPWTNKVNYVLQSPGNLVHLYSMLMK
jgi:hypothetical protein